MYSSAVVAFTDLYMTLTFDLINNLVNLVSSSPICIVTRFLQVLVQIQSSLFILGSFEVTRFTRAVTDIEL